MLQSTPRQAIAGMEADGSYSRLCGGVRGDIDFDIGVVGADNLPALLAFAYVKHWFFNFTSLAARRFNDDDREVGASTGD